MPFCGAVGDQDICCLWYRVGPDIGVVGVLECPISVLACLGGAVDAYGAVMDVNSGGGVEEVGQGGPVQLILCRVFGFLCRISWIEKDVVVPCDNDSMSVRQGVEPV